MQPFDSETVFRSQNNVTQKIPQQQRQTTNVMREQPNAVRQQPVNVMRQMSHEDMVSKLAQETGMEADLARAYLESNNWNLTEAIDGFNELLKKDKEKQQNSKTQSSTNSNRRKPFTRGFSHSNMNLVSEVRDKLTVNDNNKSNNPSVTLPSYDLDASRKNFVLPDISKYNTDLATFIRNDLISISTLQNLVATGRLNWWYEYGTCRKLFPLSTVGDGNCLLHAASLGMWGFHDRLLNLRKALHDLLLHQHAKKAIRRRWKYSVWQDNLKCGGLTYSHAEWNDEWESVVKLTSDRPRCIEGGKPSRRISRQMSFTTTTGGAAIPHLREGESLDSLESIHVYALANLLCRPLIIFSETMLKDSQGVDVAPIPFGGIYLPLEREPSSCSKYPLCLAYDASHFSALVCADGEDNLKGEKVSTSVPLEDKHFQLLPLRFAVDPGSTWDLVQDDSVKNEVSDLPDEEKIDLMRRYLDLVRVPIKNKTHVQSSVSQAKPKSEREFSLGKALDHAQNVAMGGSYRDVVLAARLNLQEKPQRYDEMMQNYLNGVKERFKASRVKCLACDFYAKPGYKGLCLECYEHETIRNEKQKAKSTSNFNINNKTKAKSPTSSKTFNYGVQQQTTSSSKENVVKTSQPFIHTKTQPTTVSQQKQQQQQQQIYATSYTQDYAQPSTKPSTNIIHTVTPKPLHTRDYVVPIKDNRSNLQRDSAITKPVPSSQIQTGVPQGNSIFYETAPPYPKGWGTSCRTPGCRFYGSDRTNGYCSSCFRK